jgi:hypothetical protein
MLPKLNVYAPADKAFEEHIQHLVDNLLKTHSPFSAKEDNDEAVERFAVGLKHVLGVRSLVEDVIKKVSEQS